MIDVTDQIAAWAASVDVHDERAVDAHSAMSVDGARRTLPRGGHRALLAAAAVVAIVTIGSLTVVAGRGGQGDRVKTGGSPTSLSSPPSTTSSPDTTALDNFAAPPGMVSVVDGEGRFVGYMHVDDDLPARPTGAVRLGSKHLVDGVPVTDRNGKLTGYGVAGLGFVTLDQAANPSTIDRLYGEHLAFVAEAKAEFDQTARTTAGN